MNKNDFSPAALLVLEKYCHWINMGLIEDGVEPLTIDDFFAYDSSRIDFDQVADDQRIIHITADYGDDGGASHLTAIFRRLFSTTDNPWELQTIFHEFDTAYRQIYLQDYITGKIGYTTSMAEVEEVEAQGMKMGLQKYTKAETKLMANRPIIHEA